MKQTHREIALFVAIVPALSAWVPLIILLVMVITQAQFGVTILAYWFAPGYWLMRLCGFTEHDLIGGYYAILPSELALKGVLTIYSLIGLIIWMLSLYVRRILKRPLWPEQRR
jgi:hypothetical protein